MAGCNAVALTSSDLWDAETAERYDDSSAFMFAPNVLDPAVAFLAELAGDGPALELAIGTGRVAIPLAERGISVTGVELSQPMVDQLHRKMSDLPVVVGDMATSKVPGEFSLVYLVWNSIGNLRTQAEQVACFRNAARHLAPGGRFVIELWIPGIRRFPPGQDAVPFHIGERHVGFDTYDMATQQGTSTSLQSPPRRDGDLRRQQLPLHLAGRMRPDGAAGRHDARAPPGRLERRPIHRRQREPRLGMAQVGLTCSRSGGLLTSEGSAYRTRRRPDSEPSL